MQIDMEVDLEMWVRLRELVAMELRQDHRSRERPHYCSHLGPLFVVRRFVRFRDDDLVCF